MAVEAKRDEGSGAEITAGKVKRCLDSINQDQLERMAAEEERQRNENTSGAR